MTATAVHCTDLIIEGDVLLRPVDLSHLAKDLRRAVNLIVLSIQQEGDVHHKDLQ